MKATSLMTYLFKVGIFLGPLFGFALHYHYHLGIVESGWEKIRVGLETLPKAYNPLLTALTSLSKFLLLFFVIVVVWLIVIPIIVMVKQKLKSIRRICKISIPVGCLWTTLSFYFLYAKLTFLLNLFFKFFTLGCQLLFLAIYLIVLGFVTIALGYIMMVSGILIVITRTTSNLKNNLLRTFSKLKVKHSRNNKEKRS